MDETESGQDGTGEKPECVARRSAMVLGISAATGLAFGTVFRCQCDEELVVPRHLINEADVSRDMECFKRAIQATDMELEMLEAKVKSRTAGTESEIFAAQREMLHDSLWHQEVERRCQRDRLNVAAAMSDAAAKFVDLFGRMDDPILRERAADVRDVARRVLGHLLHQADEPAAKVPEGCILVARELLPSLAATLEQAKVGGLVVEQGAATAHAIIIARSMGIPTVIHAEGISTRVAEGDQLMVDGLSGRVFINPSAGILQEFEQVRRDLVRQRVALNELVDVPAVTTDGVEIRLRANVGKVADAALAAACGADGIGLYRTEFAFFVHQQFPTEEEQYQVYRSAVAQVKGRAVLRILDVGSDKLLPYFPLPAEANPSLGRRGIRLLLDHPAILLTQLRAMLRLSATHEIALLFPMVGGVEEFRAARGAVDKTKALLQAEGVAFDPAVPVGAMIETPAAAMTAAWLAREADFLSIGSNDLVQYLLATDRTSMAMAAFYEPLHPAVIQSLKSVITAATQAGKPVSVCGEIAGNGVYTALLLGLGARALSVGPGELLEIKRRVRSLSLTEAERVADCALAAGTVAEVKACLCTGG